MCRGMKTGRIGVIASQQGTSHEPRAEHSHYFIYVCG
jgi:hypothetical protein